MTTVKDAFVSKSSNPSDLTVTSKGLREYLSSISSLRCVKIPVVFNSPNIGTTGFDTGVVIDEGDIIFGVGRIISTVWNGNVFDLFLTIGSGGQDLNASIDPTSHTNPGIVAFAALGSTLSIALTSGNLFLTAGANDATEGVGIIFVNILKPIT